MRNGYGDFFIQTGSSAVHLREGYLPDSIRSIHHHLLQRPAVPFVAFPVPTRGGLWQGRGCGYCFRCEQEVRGGGDFGLGPDIKREECSMSASWRCANQAAVIPERKMGMKHARTNGFVHHKLGWDLNVDGSGELWRCDTWRVGFRILKFTVWRAASRKEVRSHL